MINQTSGKQKITEDEIQHVADLARIEISAEEKKKYASEMSAVLGYIDLLNEVKTDNITPTTQVTGLVNVVRGDDPRIEEANVNIGNRKKILEGVPLKEGYYIKVKSVF